MLTCIVIGTHMRVRVAEVFLSRHRRLEIILRDLKANSVMNRGFNASLVVILSPVVQRPISPNPGLNFNSGFFISLSKSLLGKIFTINFRTSNDQIASKKI